MKNIKDSKLAFIGSGFMAQAMIRGLIESGTMPAENILVINPIDPETGKRLTEQYGIFFAPPEEIKSADAVFFAVKPQSFPEVCEMYKDYFTSDKLYLTIMAGISCESIEKEVGEAPVVRFMPNLALSVKKSATGFCLGKMAGASEAEYARNLFAPLGVAKELPESQMSAVTALSGSGPAYFYYLCESMIQAAAEDGMDRDTAQALAVQTLIGTAALIEESGECPEEMRRRITSKKGTTEAGVNALCEAGFPEVVRKGYLAARKRSDELGKQ